MQILLANAKIMRENATTDLPMTTPQFQAQASSIAREMAQCEPAWLSSALGCNAAIAAQNWCRYQNFFAADKMPAIMAYNGQAYKHLKAATLSHDDLLFAQEHLWITCFLYGLLRPLDAIVPYRMEHSVKLAVTGDRPMSAYWKDLLTDALIQAVKADGGVLIHLSTAEYENLFHWKRVKQEVTVIQPLFYVEQPDGSLRMQAVWAKSCRGAMVRHIVQNRITTPQQLTAFTHEGFVFAPTNANVATTATTLNDIVEAPLNGIADGSLNGSNDLSLNGIADGIAEGSLNGSNSLSFSGITSDGSLLFIRPAR